MPDDALIVFLPSGRRGRVPRGTTVLEAARRLGVDIDSVCGGRGLCGHCQVEVASGEFPRLGIVSRPGHLAPAGGTESRYAREHGLAAERRLACGACIGDDVVIDVPPGSQLHRQVVRKDAQVRPIEIDPLLHLRYLELEAPRIGDQRSDVERVLSALREHWGIDITEFDPRLPRYLPGILREADWKVTVVLRDGCRLVAVRPGLHDRAFGLAVDVGTTTLAAHLCDLSNGEVVAACGVMNPQIRFGEDLISRVSWLQHDPEARGELAAVARRTIADLARQTAGAAGVEVRDIHEVSVVGNPIMHHVLLGFDPLQLGRAPFPLAVDRALTFPAGELDLHGIDPCARVYVLPCIAGHVGADTAGVLLAEAPHRRDEVTLIADVGTNAELVLGNRHRLLACSSPTGPAFEGAQISSGQRAAPGAVERVRIDPRTLAPRVRVIGCDAWSDAPEFASAVAGTGVTGICGSGIIEAVAEMYLAGIVTPSGLIDGARFRGNPHLVVEGGVYRYRLYAGEPEISVTQTDVRNIQLAKAAMYAGAQLLLEHFGIERPERIVLAGAFGSYIDPKHAMVLGMIPDCPLEHVSAVGNAAGTGARIALLNRAARGEIEELVRRVEKIETAAAPGFQKSFVAGMTIPHRSHRFPNLEESVALPRAAPGHPATARAADDAPAQRHKREGASP